MSLSVCNFPFNTHPVTLLLCIQHNMRGITNNSANIYSLVRRRNTENGKRGKGHPLGRCLIKCKCVNTLGAVLFPFASSAYRGQLTCSWEVTKYILTTLVMRLMQATGSVFHKIVFKKSEFVNFVSIFGISM